MLQVLHAELDRASHHRGSQQVHRARLRRTLVCQDVHVVLYAQLGDKLEIL